MKLLEIMINKKNLTRKKRKNKRKSRSKTKR